MGGLYSKLQQPLRDTPLMNTMTGLMGRKRKRAEADDSSDDLDDILDASMKYPKKKKLLTTAQYIYQALFKEEKSSDISVLALGKLWRLHKVYLCQSPYFATMFNGSWRESDKDFISIEVVDPRITTDSLFIVFGSLYLDEVTLEPRDIISTLATATLFQLDGLIERCSEVMIESINAETAIAYYDAACLYGVPNVKRSTFDWLLANLLSFYTRHWKWLRQISVDLMHDLISHPDLFVMQTEFSIYMLLRFWTYYNLNPDISKMDQQENLKYQVEYFAQRPDKEVPFIETPMGREFRKPFEALRINHMLTQHRDIVMLLKDNILPKSWLYGPLLNQWSAMLSIDESLDKGPLANASTDGSNDKYFYESCMRCGRTLQEEGYQKWRWTGFNFGLDLILITDARQLSIKRLHRAENERLLSMQVKRNFLIRVTVASLNPLRQVKWKQSTGIIAASLEKNKEMHLLNMDKELEYPLLISVNLLISSAKAPIEGSLREFQRIDGTQGSAGAKALAGPLAATGAINEGATSSGSITHSNDASGDCTTSRIRSISEDMPQ